MHRRTSQVYKFYLSFVFLLCFGSLSGCAHTVSKEFRQQVSRPIPFQELLERGEAYMGERVILGGYILEVSNEHDGTLLKVLQAPLDSQEEPKSADLSEGRFLVQIGKFLEPEIYSKGRKLTVGGKVVAVQTQPLGNGSYQYPVIEVEELHLWPKEQPRARHYYPYYWDSPWYPYSWYWYSPFYPYWYCPYP